MTDVSKPLIKFVYSYLIWINLLIVANALTTNSNFNNDIRQHVTETNTAKNKDNFTDIYSTTIPTVASSKDTHESDGNTSFKKTVTQTYDGEILGTAAAYKLDIREPLIGCSLSEFACSNGKCIPASKFCDRVNDCDDSSDEPRFCTRKSSFACYIENFL